MIICYLELMTVKSRRFVSAINIALGTALVMSALLIMRDAVLFLKIKGKPAAEARAAPQPVRAAKKSLLDYAPVMSNNVFGLPPAVLSPITSAQKPSASLPPPDIIVSGTVSWPGKFGYAVIADASGVQNVYKTGDHVAGVGILKRVERDKIVINSNGRNMEVAVEEVASVKDIVKPGPAPPARGKKAMRLQGFVKKSEDGLYMIERNALQSALENPRQIMTDARLLPNMVNGKQEGFVIREVKRQGLYHGLGLRDGDVLMRVNEFSISDPETALQAFTALKGMDRVELDISRGGSKMTLTYVVR